MRRHIAAWCIVALGLSALAACASGPLADSSDAGSASSAGAGASAPVATPNSPAPEPSRTPPSTPRATPTKPPPVVGSPIRPVPSGSATALTGTLYAGAEPTCLLLSQGRSVYLLLAPASMKLRAGQRVTVTGKPAPRSLMTHCMQGIPFQVSQAEVLSPNG